MHASRGGRNWSGWLVAIALGTSGVQAQESSNAGQKHELPPSKSVSETPDAELLEFLGTLDTEDSELIDDLTDIDVAKPAAPPPARPAPEVKPHD